LILPAVDLPGAAVDCELIGAGFWGQPVNTATCLAFLIGAAYIWRKRRDPAMSLLVALVGLGSIAFHGPMPPGGEFLHDVTIVWVLAWVILVETGRTSRWALIFLAGAVLSAIPVVANPSQALLAVGVGVVQIRSRDQRPLRLLTLGLLLGGAVFGRLSASGGPFCDPDSLWQGHGLWHIIAALALTIWAVNLSPDHRP
jgi:hypothetical protein